MEPFRRKPVFHGPLFKKVDMLLENLADDEQRSHNTPINHQHQSDGIQNHPASAHTYRETSKYSPSLYRALKFHLSHTSSRGIIYIST